MLKRLLQGTLIVFFVISFFVPSGVNSSDIQCNCTLKVGLLTAKGKQEADAGKKLDQLSNEGSFISQEISPKGADVWGYEIDVDDTFGFYVVWQEFVGLVEQGDILKVLGPGELEVVKTKEKVYYIPESVFTGKTVVTTDVAKWVIDANNDPICNPTSLFGSKSDDGVFVYPFGIAVEKTEKNGVVPLYMYCEDADPDDTATESGSGGGSSDGIDGGTGSGCHLGVCNLNQLGTSSFPQLIGRALSMLTGIIGAVALAVFVYGGFLWMLSMGSPERIKKAQALLLWGGLGTMVIVASYAIVTFLFDIF